MGVLHVELFKLAGDLAAKRRPFVMITVVCAKGSTPRNAGARMIWTRGDGFIGTIGGGQFEELVKDAAERCFADRQSTLERFVLGSDADQCCGGTLDVFVEFIGPRQRVVIFGAGHVSHALTGMLRPSALEVVIVDDRAEWNSVERFGDARRVLDFDEGVAVCAERPDATMACVMTCSHDRDFELIRSLLEAPPAYVGLIGSRSKRACFFSRLTGAGVSAEMIERVRCPMGVGNTGKEPELVAISIASELLMRADELASL